MCGPRPVPDRPRCLCTALKRRRRRPAGAPPCTQRLPMREPLAWIAELTRYGNDSWSAPATVSTGRTRSLQPYAARPRHSPMSAASALGWDQARRASLHRRWYALLESNDPVRVGRTGQPDAPELRDRSCRHAKSRLIVRLPEPRPELLSDHGSPSPAPADSGPRRAPRPRLGG